MTDSPCGFSKDEFLAILTQYGPDLSIHEIAALGKVSIKQALCCHHHNDWDIEAFAGEKGWRYRKRVVLGKTIKYSEAPRHFHDAGITKSSPRAV